MDRTELVRWLVLREISDDYENVDQVILPAGLIRDRLAKAYLLSTKEPFSTELQGMPPLEVIEENFETYFYVTKNGVDLRCARATQSLVDDEGKLLPDWYLDPPRS